MARILCALSGGVDSSVAALLLQRQGHDLVGVFMRNGVSHGAASAAKSCCSASDARDAGRVAERLEIPFYAIDYEREFDDLITDFVAEYRRGRTPSPCVLCNQKLKFGHLYELADAVGAERIATGHYARIAGGQLLRARDAAKDQTYYLFGVQRDRLARLSFPLGDLVKSEVRELAAEGGLATAKKPESMDICFVPDGDYRALLRARAAMTPGRFVDASGNHVGDHDGYEGFTIGQRRGLPALGSPHYVVEIRAETAEVVLGRRRELEATRFTVERVNWLVDPCASEIAAQVQIRARHAPEEATIVPQSDRGDVVVSFAAPQEAITPGQAAVFYDGDKVLGGGWIASHPPRTDC